MNKVTSILNTEPKHENLKAGLSDDYNMEMAKLLSSALTDSYKLLIKNHVYHWNVVGPLFKPLHELTEAHYQNLFAAIDTLAERIRALGSTAPFHMNDAAKFAPKSAELNNTTALEMVEDLIANHEEISRSIRDIAENAGDNKDMVTEDLLTSRLAFHEKAIWMLRAIVSK